MEVILVLAIALIVLGPKKLPEAAPLRRQGPAGVQGVRPADPRHDDEDDDEEPEPKRAPEAAATD